MHFLGSNLAPSCGISAQELCLIMIQYIPSSDVCSVIPLKFLHGKLSLISMHVKKLDVHEEEEDLFVVSVHTERWMSMLQVYISRTICFT